MGLVFELRCCDQDSVKIDARVRVTYRLDLVTVYGVTYTIRLVALILPTKLTRRRESNIN